MVKKNKLGNVLQRQQAAFKKASASQQAQEPPTKKSAKAKGKVKAAEEEPTKKPWLPFNENHRILLVGEANFSFSLSLLTHHFPNSGPNVIATSYDSLDVCKSKYEDAEDNIAKLKELGAIVIFSVDAGALEAVKALKGKIFDRIVFNYPHVGLGEKDQDRNIRLNQTLCLRFLGSSASLLEQGSMPKSVTTASAGKKRKREDYDSEGEDVELSDERGSILLTLRDAKPYTDWNIPSLAKKGSLFVSSLLPKAKDQPEYVIVRSGVFDATLYPGYAHRRTIGYKAGTSFDDSVDTKYSAKERKKAEKTQEAGMSKMWQFCLSGASS